MMPAPRLLLMTGEWPVPGKAQPPSFARRQADALHTAGMTVEIFAFRGGSNPYNYAAAWTRLRPRFRAGLYDLIHAHFAHSGLLALPRRLPVVVTLRERDLGIPGRTGGPSTPAERLRNLLARWIARHVDAVIVNAEELRQHLGKGATVHVIPLGLDEAAHTARLIEVYRSVLSPS